MLPPDRIVLELLESIDYTPQVVAAIRRAVDEGYRFALDDVVTSDGVPDEVIALVELVKIDVLAVDRDHLGGLVERLRRRAPQATLLAEKVEEHADVEHCAALGFELFQGYFFAKPEVLSRVSRPVTSAAALALLVEVQRPDVDIGEAGGADHGRSDGRVPAAVARQLEPGRPVVPGRFGAPGDRAVRHEQVRQLATLLTMAAHSADEPRAARARRDTRADGERAGADRASRPARSRSACCR